LWTPSDPDSGAGAALREVEAEVQRQGLTRAGSVYIRLGQPADDGRIPGEAVIPVNRPGESTEAVEAITLPATTAFSVVYRDDIHLSDGAPAMQQLREHAVREGVTLRGQPRWIYHTSPDWNLEPDDHLIELLWPIR
jgi:hypothetical protein